MKPHPIPYHSSKSRIPALLVAAFLPALPAVSIALEQIVADFEAGNTEMAVDAFPGMPGDGWVDGWTAASNTNVLFHVEVIDADPLDDGGNYAHASMEHEHTTAFRNMRISRHYQDFGSIALDQPHSISFLYRLDSGIEHLNRPRFFDDLNGILGPGDDTTWKIRTSETEWRFEHWDPATESNVEQHTGMELYEGDVYLFRIEVDPATNTYVGTVENLDHEANLRPGPPSFTTEPLHFMNDHQHPHGHLNFVLTLDAHGGDLVRGSFSLDSLQIAP